MLSEQPPACAGYPPDRPDPPPVSVHVLLMSKWPEKAVSESRDELVQWISLVQVKRVRASLSRSARLK